MRKKGQSVIKIICFIAVILGSNSILAQEFSNPTIINNENFIKSIRINMPHIFAMNPLGNIDSVKYQGYYAILKIKNGKVTEILYPNEIKSFLTRRSEFAKKNLNEKLKLKEFEFLNIDQIIISAIIDYIHFDDKEINLDEVLEKLLPETGYTSNTFVLPPIILRTGNPMR